MNLRILNKRQNIYGIPTRDREKFFRRMPLRDAAYVMPTFFLMTESRFPPTKSSEIKKRKMNNCNQKSDGTGHMLSRNKPKKTMIAKAFKAFPPGAIKDHISLFIP